MGTRQSLKQHLIVNNCKLIYRVLRHFRTVDYLNSSDIGTLIAMHRFQKRAIMNEKQTKLRKKMQFRNKCSKRARFENTHSKCSTMSLYALLRLTPIGVNSKICFQRWFDSIQKLPFIFCTMFYDAFKSCRKDTFYQFN